MDVSQRRQRILYDQDFLDLGCPPELYDENYETDNTLWSWITNFMILGVCVLACLKLLCFPSSSSTSSRQKPSTNKLILLFFLLTGIAFGFGGLNHSTIERNDDPLKDVYERITLGVFGIATGCLLVSSFQMLSANRIGLWLLTLISLGITVYAVVVKDQTSIGAFQMLVTLFASVVYTFQVGCCGRRRCGNDTANSPRLFWINITKSIGVFLLLGGLVVQLLLAPTCGDAGYEQCFENCPLPNPTVFNQNALFHIIYLVGLVVLAIAEDQYPSISRSAASIDQNGQGEEAAGSGDGEDDVEKHLENTSVVDESDRSTYHDVMIE